MQIDFREPGTWLKISDHVAEELGVDLSKVGVRVYQNTSHALVEMCVGISKLYPLKKKIYYFKNMNPLFEPALMPLAREGYKLLPLDIEVLEQPGEWISKLDREDLFVLYSADEPILGQAFNTQTFDTKIKESNIFRIKVSHSRHFYESDELMTTCKQDKNRADIYAVDGGQAIVVTGERGRIGALTADQLNYSLPLKLDWFGQSRKLNHDTVLRFESDRVADSRPVFGLERVRVLDRALIYWPDLDGAAMQERMAKKMGIDLNAPGFERQIETTSLSRWGGVRTMDFLLTQGLTPEMIRGLVVIDSKLLDSRSEFDKNLKDVRNSILQDQSGV